MGLTNAAEESSLFKSLYPNGYKPYQLKWYDIAIAVLIFIIVSIAYIQTLTPSLGAGDNGELVTALYNMGACHPPGYPLYGIVGKLFTFIPVGDIAYRVNLFVALCGSASVLFLYLIIVKLLGLNRDTGKINLAVHLPAIAGAFLFGFSQTHWGQSVGGEVYSLNQLLVSFMLYVMVLWYEEMIYFRSEGRLHFAQRMTLLLAFSMGLSLTDHMLPVWYIVAFILILLPATIFIVISDRSKKFMDEFKKRIGVFVIFVLLALVCVYLFMTNAYFPRLIPKWAEDPKPTIAILVAIFLVPSFLTVYVIYRRLTKSEDNWVDKFFEVFTVGIWLMIFAMTLYLYLMVRAIAVAPLPDPKPLSWGDTQSLDILFNHMLRKQYGAGGGGDLNNFFGQVGAIFNIMLRQFHWLNMLFAGIGLVYLFIKDKIWAIYSLGCIALLSLMLIKFVNFEIDPRTMSFQEVMYIQNYLFVALYIAFGYQLILDLSNKLFKKKA